jgi:rhodanese-related sulfurtransferase
MEYTFQKSKKQLIREFCSMRKPFYLIIFFFFVSLSLHGQIADSLKYKNLLPQEFRYKIRNDTTAALIDVREFFEFRKERIKSAVNVPMSGNLKPLTDSIKTNISLLLYCKGGVRSVRAAVKLYNAGYRNLYSLKGGIEGWKKAGLPVVRRHIKLTAPIGAAPGCTGGYSYTALSEPVYEKLIL